MRSNMANLNRFDGHVTPQFPVAFFIAVVRLLFARMINCRSTPSHDVSRTHRLAFP